jgi:enoyl-CoA hydratase/carnithine racemase
MNEPLVRRTDRDGVAIIELHRPHRKNAIVAPMLDELTAHVEAASASDSTGVVLLCGAGGAFCSGLDLTEYNADPPPAWLPTASRSLKAAHVALGACPKPVVVALERFAINGGAAFALAGDLIVAGRDAWLQVGEARLGMNAPMNLAWLVARYPMATVLQIVLPGARLTGGDLLLLGIAHEVVDDDQVRVRAEALAAEIASYPAGSARRLKQSAFQLANHLPATTITSEWFDRAAALAPTAAPPPLP